MVARCIISLLHPCFVLSKNDHTHQAILMTVKLQRTGNKKSKVMIAMRYKNSKTVAMRCKTDVMR